MSVLSRIREFVEAALARPEDEINTLLDAFAVAKKKGLPDGEEVRRFQELAQMDVLVQGHYRLLVGRARDNRTELTLNEQVCMYTVAVAACVLALLGHDPGAPWLRTLEDNARMERSCMRQRTCVDLGRVNQANLVHLLFESLVVKDLWQTMNDPRKQLCQITVLETWARDEWWKAHPMPEES